MSEELKPCPFCNEPVEEREERGWYACSNNDCPAWHLQAQLEGWNTRAQPVATGGELEVVARVMVHGPLFKGLCEFEQARTYAEFPKEAVEESNGYWLEGAALVRQSDALAERAADKARIAELEEVLREVAKADPRGEFFGWQLDGKIDEALAKGEPK